MSLKLIGFGQKINSLIKLNNPVLSSQFNTIFKSNYHDSPLVEDLGPIKRQYEISRDPEEWKFVERVLPPTVIPEPLKKDKYPSGWKPQSEHVKNNQYFVGRSKNHMLPVYLKIVQNGVARRTYIRRIQGDIWALHDEVVQFLQKQNFQRIRSQVHEFAGYILINGDYVNAVKYFLEEKGY